MRTFKTQLFLATLFLLIFPSASHPAPMTLEARNQAICSLFSEQSGSIDQAMLELKNKKEWSRSDYEGTGLLISANCIEAPRLNASGDWFWKGITRKDFWVAPEKFGVDINLHENIELVKFLHSLLGTYYGLHTSGKGHYPDEITALSTQLFRSIQTRTLLLQTKLNEFNRDDPTYETRQTGYLKTLNGYENMAIGISTSLNETHIYSEANRELYLSALSDTAEAWVSIFSNTSKAIINNDLGNAAKSLLSENDQKMIRDLQSAIKTASFAKNQP